MKLKTLNNFLKKYLTVKKNYFLEFKNSLFRNKNVKDVLYTISRKNPTTCNSAL